MPLYKCHERNEHRDDAMILAAENMKAAAKEYARHLMRIDAEKYGPGCEPTGYAIMVREPGGPPKRFDALPDLTSGELDVVVREWVPL